MKISGVGQFWTFQLIGLIYWTFKCFDFMDENLKRLKIEKWKTSARRYWLVASATSAPSRSSARRLWGHCGFVLWASEGANQNENEKNLLGPLILNNERDRETERERDRERERQREREKVVRESVTVGWRVGYDNDHPHTHPPTEWHYYFLKLSTTGRSLKIITNFNCHLTLALPGSVVEGVMKG